MNKLLNRLKLAIKVLQGRCITMVTDKNKCLNVDVGDNDKKYVKLTATYFFKTALSDKY